MNPNKLTTKAQEALQAMQAIASERGHQALEPEHLLLALLDQKDGVVIATLQKMNISLDVLSASRRESIAKTSAGFRRPALHEPGLGSGA